MSQVMLLLVCSVDTECMFSKNKTINRKQMLVVNARIALFCSS